MTHHQTNSGEPERHPKQDFQVERIAFFSDAVVAIAITLLILEIKIPHISKDSTYSQVMDQLSGLSYGFLALVLSFIVISNYWMVHHLLFKHIINYNRRILWSNMIFLFTIIIFPFTISLFAESDDNKSVFSLAFKLFFLNNILSLLALSSVYWIAFKIYKEFSYRLSPEEDSEIKNDLFFPLLVFSLLFFGSFFTDNMEILFGVNFAVVLGKRIYKGVKKGKKK
jgi:uncharacterized membrane protein